MPTFELYCDDCKITFELKMDSAEELKEVFCPLCQKQNYSPQGYDLYDDPKMIEVFARLTELEKRFDEQFGPETIDDIDIN